MGTTNKIKIIKPDWSERIKLRDTIIIGSKKDLNGLEEKINRRSKNDPAYERWVYEVVMYDKSQCFYKIGQTKNWKLIKKDQRIKKFINAGFKILIVAANKYMSREAVYKEESFHRDIKKAFSTGGLKPVKPRRVAFAGSKNECYTLPTAFKCIESGLISNYEAYDKVIDLSDYGPNLSNALEYLISRMDKSSALHCIRYYYFLKKRDVGSPRFPYSLSCKVGRGFVVNDQFGFPIIF